MSPPIPCHPMTVHPGKKLNFMGNEIGQFREWDEKREQDWNLRTYPVHDAFYRFMAELNLLYLSHSALSERDYAEDGFRWLDCHQESRCVYAVERRSGTERLAAVFNFSECVQRDYEVEIQDAVSVTSLIDTDWEKYGGRTPETSIVCRLDKGRITCSLQPFVCLILSVPTCCHGSMVSYSPKGIPASHGRRRRIISLRAITLVCADRPAPSRTVREILAKPSRTGSRL